MAIYLKKFKNVAEYNAYIASGGTKPKAYLTTDDNVVYYLDEAQGRTEEFDGYIDANGNLQIYNASAKTFTNAGQIKGEKGDAAGFGTPTASATTIESGATAWATVTASGTDKAKVFGFNFGIPKGDKGDPGSNGSDGNTPYIFNGYWYINGTNTNVKAEGKDGTGITVKSSSAECTNIGDAYISETDGHIYFLTSDGTFSDGGAVKGDKGDSVEWEWSNDSTSWHSSYRDGDKYIHLSLTSDTTWSEALKIVGDEGQQGEKGEKGDSVQLQWSANGSTNWHDTYQSGDKYIHQKMSTATTYSNAIKVVGADGEAAGFGTPIASATSIASTATPTVTVTATGEDTAKVFNFAFEIPKGEKGDDGTSITHSWNGTALTIKSGSGESVPVDLQGIPGNDGASVQLQWSANGSTNWHDTYQSGDKYIHQKMSTATTYSNAIKVVGADGEAAGFGTPIASATSIASTATPTVTVTATGEDTAKVFNFAFEIPKGEKGDDGDTYLGTSADTFTGTGEPTIWGVYNGCFNNVADETTIETGETDAAPISLINNAPVVGNVENTLSCTVSLATKDIVDNATSATTNLVTAGVLKECLSSGSGGLDISLNSNKRYVVGYEELTGNAVSELNVASGVYTTDGTKLNAEGFYETSDERLKNFSDDVTVDFEKLTAIPKKYFTWKVEDDRGNQIGTSAQKVKELYPEIVSETDGILSVDYSKLSIIALAAIDKLYEKSRVIDTLTEKIEKLEEEIKSLKDNQ